MEKAAACRRRLSAMGWQWAVWRRGVQAVLRAGVVAFELVSSGWGNPTDQQAKGPGAKLVWQWRWLGPAYLELGAQGI